VIFFDLYKVGLIEDMVDEAIDDAMEIDEKKVDEEVAKVMNQIMEGTYVPISQTSIGVFYFDYFEIKRII
jgi:hypothetical protein